LLSIYFTFASSIAHAVPSKTGIDLAQILKEIAQFSAVDDDLE
jgi:hypothetical protein